MSSHLARTVVDFVHRAKHQPTTTLQHQSQSHYRPCLGSGGTSSSSNCLKLSSISSDEHDNYFEMSPTNCSKDNNNTDNILMATSNYPIVEMLTSYDDTFSSNYSCNNNNNNISPSTNNSNNNNNISYTIDNNLSSTSGGSGDDVVDEEDGNATPILSPFTTTLTSKCYNYEMCIRERKSIIRVDYNYERKMTTTTTFVCPQ